MSRPLSFKAQALDNTSPDHYQIGEELLSARDEARCYQVTKTISEIARDGTLRLKKGGAELFVQRERFLAQVYSEQLDQVGRRVPILCCGAFGLTDDPEAIIEAIHGFAAKIGRTVAPGHIKAVRDGLAEVKKKRCLTLLFAGAGVIALVAGLMLFTLHHGLSRRTQMQDNWDASTRTRTPGR
jgi:hypothetical protein